MKGRRPSGAGRSAKRKHETEEVPSFLSTGPRHLGVEEWGSREQMEWTCLTQDFDIKIGVSLGTGTESWWLS